MRIYDLIEQQTVKKLKVSTGNTEMQCFAIHPSNFQN